MFQRANSASTSEGSASDGEGSGEAEDNIFINTRFCGRFMRQQAQWARGLFRKERGTRGGKVPAHHSNLPHHLASTAYTWKIPVSPLTAAKKWWSRVDVYERGLLVTPNPPNRCVFLSTCWNPDRHLHNSAGVERARQERANSNPITIIIKIKHCFFYELVWVSFALSPNKLLSAPLALIFLWCCLSVLATWPLPPLLLAISFRQNMELTHPPQTIWQDLLLFWGGLGSKGN